MYDFIENTNDNTFDLNQIIDTIEQNETDDGDDFELSFTFDNN